MTYEKYFVAIRHESEIMTPLVESPFINFSLREMGYLGAFGLSAVFAAIGSVPLFFVALTFPFFILAFFRWHGEIPEMYIYFMIMSFLDQQQSSKKNRKNKRNNKEKTKRTKSDISGFGEIVSVNTKKEIRETIQKITFSDDATPLDITLDIGKTHKHETVTVLIEGTKVMRDNTNGAGLITISVMPQRGKKKFSIKDENNHTIICKTVEFAGEK